jgi:BirA family biotin operon repressor/biotin-[acetyl-CoA-carboxylase] ligase
VTAEFQSLGRGLTRTEWASEEGKNLLCSILIKFDKLKITNSFYLSCAISIGVYNAISKFNLPHLSVKWPNDIMSGSSKLGGILIENSLKNEHIYQTIVGLGLNINQDSFPVSLPNAISMKQIKREDFSRDEILIKIVDEIKETINLLKCNEFDILHKKYENILFKNGEVQMFEDINKNQFSGKIIGVNRNGMLKVENEKKNLEHYDHKQIKFL